MSPWNRLCLLIDRKASDWAVRQMHRAVRRDERDPTDVVPVDYWEDRHQ